MSHQQENYLEEQRTAMAQLSEERRLLVEERSKFAAEQKSGRDRMAQDAVKRSQVCAMCIVHVSKRGHSNVLV